MGAMRNALPFGLPLLLLVPALLGAAPARATELDVGVGAALSMDLPDRVSSDYARFGPGPSLQIPIRVGFSEHAYLRSTLRADLGIGSDRVTWALDVDGEQIRVGSDEHWAMFTAAGLTLGPEIALPLDAPVVPVIGAEAGGAWVGTYHSFGGDTAVLLDPAQNDLQSSGNIDPFTSQLAFLTDVHAGVASTGEGVGFWGELGYSMAFLGASPLKKSPKELDARREAYGWNAARLGVGVRFSL